MAGVVRREHGIAAKNIALEDAGKSPGQATVVSKSPAGLAEIGVHAVELSPANRHLIAIGRIDGDRRLVGRVSRDVLSVTVDIDLVTGERTVLRNLAVGYARSPDKHGGIARTFQRFPL